MWIYNLVVRCYGGLIALAALRNKKAALWLAGRKNWQTRIDEQLAKAGPGARVWIHCASYGEFEQGRPLIEAIQARYPNHVIVLSFFSPSGYEAFKNWSGARVVCYLPLDTKQNAATFLSLVKPQAAIFVKYEFWLNFLFELQSRQVPSYLVSAVFKEHHPFFKWYGGVFRRSLQTFTRLFLQDSASGQLLNAIGIANHNVCGDTRFDRVLALKQQVFHDERIAAFKGKALLIVAGSTWSGDEELVLQAFGAFQNKNVKLLLASHEINPQAQAATELKLKKLGLTFTHYAGDFNADAQVLLLNTLGVLARAYRYGECAYVGGGFNDGLHNVLEPAVYGIPVSFFGSKYHKYNEAVDLLRLGLAHKANTVAELTVVLEKHLWDADFRKTTRANLDAYFAAGINATGRILSALKL